MPSNKMISDFSDKPKTDSFYQVIDEYVMSLGKVKKEFRAQVSYSVNRKFLWMWAYEKTKDGTLYFKCDPGSPGGEQEYPQGHSGQPQSMEPSR